MDDAQFELFEWPEITEVKPGPASAETVALWLHGQGIYRIESYVDLRDWFNEYGVQFGYHRATEKKISQIVKKSPYWRTKRGKKPAKKTFYEVKIPRSVLIREVA